MNEPATNAPPNICFVARYHYTERVGGAEVQAWLLARELARRGHPVSYICESLTGRGGTIQTIEGVEVIWLLPRTHLDLLGLPRYARALSRLDPDIVIHRYTSGYESVIGRFCRRKAVKFVWICTDDASPVRHYFMTRQRDILKRQPRPLYKRIILLLHAWAKDRSREYGMRFVTHPCVQNAAQARLFREQFRGAAFHFPSGHETPESLPEKTRPPVILWVAGFSAGKRPGLFAALANECADLPAQFVMISKKVPAGRHMEETEVRRLTGGNTDFQWRVDVPFEETLSWFDRASVFVNTSTKESEGFPNTFVQAWSRGVPVISFGVDPDNILTRQDLGKCVGSIGEARAAILDYINAPDLAATRARLHRIARTRFDIGNVADRLFEIVAQDRCAEDWCAEDWCVEDRDETAR